MRRYELMLVLRPDLPDDRTQAVIDRTTRAIAAVGRPDRQGRPMGPPPARLPDRPAPRRLVPHHPLRGPADAILELERGLQITEELLRHLVTRVERPVKAAVATATTRTARARDRRRRRTRSRTTDPDTELIDESESEAAPGRRSS